MFETSQARPFSADIAPLAKARFQSSNCPMILKHESVSPVESYRLFSATGLSSRQQLASNRPNTANNIKSMKFGFAPGSTGALQSPTSQSNRPVSVGMSSTANLEFVAELGRANNRKFQDNSKIKPRKKLKVDNFHNMIYKIKQEKEQLEKEINRVEVWHRHLKENDIWSSPQQAIVGGILKMNALSNPDGNVGKLLESEKEFRERENTLRAIKRSERPTSAYAHLNKKGPINPKSVQDFFAETEDEDEKLIDGIIGKHKHYYKQYNSHKPKIIASGKGISLGNGNSGMYNTWSQSTRQQPATEYSGVPYMQGLTSFDGVSSNQGIERSGAQEEPFGKSISEIAESSEGGTETAMNQNPKSSSAAGKVINQFSKKNIFSSHEKQRPYSAINSTFSPRSFSNASSLHAIGTQRIPAAIHTRSGTAKQLRMTPTSSFGSGIFGEAFQQSIPNVKFIPLSMQGQKIHIDPSTSNRNIATATSSKFMTMREEETIDPVVFSAKGSKSTRALKSNPSFRGKDSKGKKVLGEKDKIIHINIFTTKSQNPRPATSDIKAWNVNSTDAVSKLNIDGDYFQTSKQSAKKNVLDSWITRTKKPQPEPIATLDTQEQ